MQRQPVISSNLAAVGYEPSRRVLEIEFLNGTIYQYREVPVSIYQGLMAAASHGSYFHANIRSHYLYTRIN